LSGGLTFDNSKSGFGDFEVGGEEFKDGLVGFALVRGGSSVNRKMSVIELGDEINF